MSSASNDAAAAIADLETAIDRLRGAEGAGGHGPGAPIQRMADAALVTGDRPIPVRPGPLAGIRRRVKAATRRATRWYVEGLAHEVRIFQVASVDAAKATATRADRQEEELGELSRRVSALTERLVRMERAARAPARQRPEVGVARAPEASPPAAERVADSFDYFGFELAGRGTLEEISARQNQYVELFADRDPVLDAGCGRGEFLELLKDAGIEARGADTNPDMVAHCRERGMDVAHADAIGVLEGLDEDSLGGLFAAQLVEHLAPARLVAFLEGAARALRPDGRIVLETINPASLVALRNYFADLTHEQPLVPETLAFLVESTGFREVEIRYTSPVDDAARLAHPTGDGVPPEMLATLGRNVDLLNALLFAPQDYAIIARL